MSKVSIIGAGNVGATAAMKIAKLNVVKEIVLLDIKEGVAEGKAMDINQCAMSDDFTTYVTGVTNDYSATANSDVIVITSGMARKPGMTREELVGINSKIMDSVVRSCDQYSPDAAYVIVSNPVDTMTMQALKILSKLHDGKQIMESSVIGMGNLLDSARFRYFIWEAIRKKDPNPVWCMNDIVNTWVIGGHGDATMVPNVDDVEIVTSYGARLNMKVVFTDDEIADIVDKTVHGGSILTNLLGTSAWEGAGASIAKTVYNILKGGQGAIPCSVYRRDLDCCIGTMTHLGKSFGHYGVVMMDVEDGELYEKVKSSAEAIKKVNSEIPE